jgi:hypothetical protein
MFVQAASNLGVGKRKKIFGRSSLPCTFSLLRTWW